MAYLYALWVPTLIVAHLLGFSLLLYSLEQIGGHISKFWRKTSDSEEQNESDIESQKEGVEKETGGAKVIQLTASPLLETASPLQTPPPASLQWSGISYQVLDTMSMNHKTVLTGCVGSASAGETVALMGPSGAGKTTLLDALAGRNTGDNLKGKVLLNGRPAAKYLRRYSQYVPQEDAFVATQTTLETLKFRAGLTVPSSIPKEERDSRILAVIEVMGLLKVKNTKVGGLLPGGIVVRGLSGGEKRRLSIASALVANPSILFLDEPTTGLDSFAALSVMDHMAQLAYAGHTIVASIHQPRVDIFNHFNKVVILSEGHQLYAGPPSQCVDWFSNVLHYSYNDARDGAVSDWIMDTISVGFTKPKAMAQRSMTTLQDVIKAADIFSQSVAAKPPVYLTPIKTSPAPDQTNTISTPSPDGKYTESSSIKDKLQIEVPVDVECPPVSASPNPVSPYSAVSEASPRLEPRGQFDKHKWASKKYAASWPRQYRFLVKRAFLSQLRNPTDTSSRLLMSTWVGTLAGLVFANLPEGAASTQQRLALLFFMLLLYQLMPFCFMSFFVADRRFYQADVAAGLYAPSAYYLAAVTASTPAIIVNTTCGGLMAYGLGGLRYTGYAVIMYLIVLALQALVSHQLQIFCVWLTPNQDMAYTVATGYVAASILLSGFYLRISAIKFSFIRGLSWLSYTKYAMQAAGRIELKDRLWGPDTCDTSSTDPITGARSQACVTQGEEMLQYYGYTINDGVLVAALVAAYIILHLGSYLALSRLHKSR